MQQLQIDQLGNKDVYDASGEKIGSMGRIYTDSNGKPEFATVKTGLFGLKESFIPLEQANLDNGGVRVPFAKEQVKDAPKIDADHDDLTPAEEATLYSHYGRTAEYDTWRNESQDALRLRRYDDRSTI